MSPHQRQAWMVFGLLGLAGCWFGKEGGDPAECFDEIDNDRDGQIDCIDADCRGIGGCGGADTDLQPDTASDTETGPSTYAEFNEAYTQALCGWYDTCDPDRYTGLVDCVTDNTGPEECIGFDVDAARRCVDQLALMTCLGSGSTPSLPEACDSVCVDAPDTGDTDWCWYDDPLQISTITYDCSPTTGDISDRSGQWSYDVLTDGFASRVTVDVVESVYPNWPVAPVESHDLDNVAYDDECGAWDEWSVTLSQVHPFSAHVSGQSSSWGCSSDNAVGGAGGMLSWMVTVYDFSDDPVECAYWGYRAETFWHGDRGYDCLCFDIDGDCTN